MPQDWVDWHRRYDQPESSLHLRLESIQGHIARALDAQPPGEIRLLSMCAGQGRDVLGALRDHVRRADVRALLVELDPRNVESGRAEIARLGLTHVRVVEGDASTTSAYSDIVPADLALVCGVFGNIVDDDIRTTINTLPSLLADGAAVVWTRYPREPDLLPRIDGWFHAAGFDTVAIETGEGGAHYGIGVHRFVGEPTAYAAGVRMFSFVDDPDPRGRRRG